MPRLLVALAWLAVLAFLLAAGFEAGLAVNG